MDWATVIDFVLKVLAGVAIAAVAWSARQLHQRKRSLSPLDIFVEQDTSIIFSGIPDWASFPYYFPVNWPNALRSSPPDRAVDWWEWAKANGGTPACNFEIAVTFSVRTEATVVIDSFRVEILSYEPVSNVGFVAIKPVGGADIVHRQISIDFFAGSTAFVEFVDGESMERTNGFSYALKKDEVCRLSITGSARQEELVYKWVGKLDMIVAGRRRTLRIDDHGKPFVLHGGAEVPHYTWTGEWIAESVE